MKSNATRNTVLVIMGIYFLILLVTVIFAKENIGAAGLFGFLFSIGIFILGVLISISKELREVGKGLMIGALIIGVVGFSICSMNFNI